MKGIIASLLWAGGFFAVTVLMTGCAGIELGGKAGIYRVDQRQESQATHRNPLPLKCYLWADCSGQQAPASNGGMVEGS